jgi:hypothetical protein
MPSEKALQALIEKKLEVKRSRVTKDHYEAGKLSYRSTYCNFTEVSPIDLGLFCGKIS